MDRHRQRFTLIELLVVVAIIAILAALLFPALRNAKETAHRANCMSNLKNNGLVLNAYSNDYDQFHPPGVIETSSPLNPWHLQPILWMDLLYWAEYLKVREFPWGKRGALHQIYTEHTNMPLVCPSGGNQVYDPNPTTPNESVWGRWRTYNIKPADWDMNYNNCIWTNFSYSGNAYMGQTRDSQVRHPTQFIRLLDGATVTGTTSAVVTKTLSYQYPFRGRHWGFERHALGGRNPAVDSYNPVGRQHFLFFDGHVDPQLPRDFSMTTYGERFDFPKSRYNSPYWKAKDYSAGFD